MGLGAGGQVGGNSGGYSDQVNGPPPLHPDLPPALQPGQSPYPLGPAHPPRSGKTRVIALALVGVLLLAGGGAVAGWALSRGGDGGSEPDRPRVTRAADAPKDADTAEFCRSMAEGETDTDEEKRKWAQEAVQVGTPSDMTDDERNGYEVLFRDSLEGQSQQASGGDVADMFLLIAYIGKTCPNVTAPAAPQPTT